LWSDAGKDWFELMADSLLDALSMAFAMGWEILWPLILGFTLSAVIQAVVSHGEMARLLPDDRPATIAKALALGAASSSCSYAAVAIARSLFRKGANFTAAMAFEMASTNLVLELSIIMLVFLGWQFTLAEFVGAPVMVAFLVLLFRTFLSRKLLAEARKQADKGIAGRMEGHAAMDMSVTEGGSLWQRITSDRGLTAISHYFVMDWASVWMDIVGGLLIAGALAAWVPNQFWQSFFLVDHPTLAKIWGPHRWAVGVGHRVRVLRRKHPARSRALERWYQFRRRDRVHLRRSDRASDPQHLSQVLRAFCSQPSARRWRGPRLSSN
jgi:uncharacterized membrane protein YraQ (UPF0718 family)